MKAKRIYKFTSEQRDHFYDAVAELSPIWDVIERAHTECVANKQPFTMEADALLTEVLGPLSAALNHLVAAGITLPTSPLGIDFDGTPPEGGFG